MSTADASATAVTAGAGVGDEVRVQEWGQGQWEELRAGSGNARLLTNGCGLLPQWVVAAVSGEQGEGEGPGAVCNDAQERAPARRVDAAKVAKAVELLTQGVTSFQVIATAVGLSAEVLQWVPVAGAVLKAVSTVVSAAGTHAKTKGACADAMVFVLTTTELMNRKINDR